MSRGLRVRLRGLLAYAGTFIGVSIACAVSASLPALRAARIDPIATLRED